MVVVAAPVPALGGLDPFVIPFDPFIPPLPPLPFNPLDPLDPFIPIPTLIPVKLPLPVNPILTAKCAGIFPLAFADIGICICGTDDEPDAAESCVLAGSADGGEEGLDEEREEAEVGGLVEVGEGVGVLEGRVPVDGGGWGCGWDCCSFHSSWRTSRRCLIEL